MAMAIFLTNGHRLRLSERRAKLPSTLPSVSRLEEGNRDKSLPKDKGTGPIGHFTLNSSTFSPSR